MTTARPLSIEEAAHDWAVDLKLGREIKNLIPTLRLDDIFKTWNSWRKGRIHRQLELADLGHGVHGLTSIRNGKVRRIAISSTDPKRRQLLTVVHELLHAFAHPARPPHRDIHTLAAGLAYNIFPQFVGKETTLLDSDELAILNDLMDDDDIDEELGLDDDTIDLEEMMDDDGSTFYGLDDDDDDEDYDDDDYDLYFSKKWRRKLRKFRKSTVGKILAPHKFITSALKKKKRRKRAKRAARAAVARASVIPAGRKVMQKVQSAGPGALATTMSWGGWILPAITRMYEGQTLLYPKRGLIRAAPQHNIYGYKASTWDAFWSQLIQSLNSGDNRTVKSWDKQIAVAAADTVATLTSRSIGAIVRISDSITDGTNESFRVRHFTQAGGQEVDYIIDVELDKGVAEYIVLHVENDRGAGIVSARNDHEIRIPADLVRPGVRLTVESINLRELQA